MTNPLSTSSNHKEFSSNFRISLQELREMRSHLHSAADHYVSAFCEAQDKKQVVKSSKEYLCGAVVSIVDRLGSVASQLNSIISHTNDFKSEELRISTIKQRLQCCEYYAQRRSLPRLMWDVNVPRLDKRFVHPPDASTECFRAFSSSKLDENFTNGKVSSHFHFKNEGEWKARKKINKRRDIKTLMTWRKDV